MHALSFLQKRTHLCAVARGREMFLRVPDMTPARFDLLHVIYKGTPGEGLRGCGGRTSLAQEDVTRALGLARQTVWKMVERLIELEWLKKVKSSRPRRRNFLVLTDTGLRRIRQALGAAFTESLLLPRDAPVPDDDGDVPRYWRRPELADPLPPAPAPVTQADIDAEIEKNLDLDRIWNEACAKGYIDTWGPPSTWGPLPKLTPPPPPPPRVGREVEKIYTSLAWRLLPQKGRTGRRGKQSAHLHMIDELVMAAERMAAALGNVTGTIYSNRYMLERYC